MKIIIVMAAAVVTLTYAIQGFAIPVGTCLPPAEMRKQLSAEGQSVSKMSEDQTSILALDGNTAGYVLEARNASWCVVSALQDVGTITAADNDYVDICDDSKKFPGAVQVCGELKGKLRFVGSVVGRAAKGSLSTAMTGPVNVLLAICLDRNDQPVLCGRTETKSR